MSEHVCRPSEDPRKPGRCACGQPIPATTGLRRMIALEREIVREAARGYVDPSRLIEHSQTRSTTLASEYVPDPMLIAAGHDRIHEAREELADCVSHLVFWWQEHLDDEDLRPSVQHALRLVALAYDHLTKEA